MKKAVADKLFPVIKELELQGAIQQFDIVMTWSEDEQETLIGFLDAGMIKELLTQSAGSEEK
jgi:hypothetical protein